MGCQFAATHHKSVAADSLLYERRDLIVAAGVVSPAVFQCHLVAWGEGGDGCAVGAAAYKGHVVLAEFAVTGVSAHFDDIEDDVAAAVPCFAFSEVENHLGGVVGRVEVIIVVRVDEYRHELAVAAIERVIHAEFVIVDAFVYLMHLERADFVVADSDRRSAVVDIHRLVIRHADDTCAHRAAVPLVTVLVRLDDDFAVADTCVACCAVVGLVFTL